MLLLALKTNWGVFCKEKGARLWFKTKQFVIKNCGIRYKKIMCVHDVVLLFSP